MNGSIMEVIPVIVALSVPIAILAVTSKYARELKERRFIERVCIGGPL